MTMINVDSSNIKAIGYDKEDLYVQYNTGTYVYKKVPKSLHESLMKAESKGRFVSTEVKGKFEYERLS